MKNKWIKKGDKVRILTGNYLGNSGNVLRRKGNKVVVQGVNIRKKHVKRRAQQTQIPTIIEVEMPFHISNVCLCDDEGKRVDLKARSSKKGGKELVYTMDAKETVFRSLRKG